MAIENFDAQNEKLMEFERYKMAVDGKLGLTDDEKDFLIKMVEDGFQNLDIEVIRQGIEFIKNSELEQIRKQIESYKIINGLSDGMTEIELGLQKLRGLVNKAVKEGAKNSRVNDAREADLLLNQI